MNNLNDRYNSRDRLLEVLGHELLEVEVGELILCLYCEELLELGIRDNLAAVGDILKLVGADVRVNLAGDIGTSKERTMGLGEEISKLVADEGWLYKTTGSTSSVLVLALVALSLIHI